MDFYVLSVIFIGLITVFYYYLVQKQKYWEKQNIPTAKCKYVPLLGHMWPLITFQKSLGEVLKACYDSVPNSSMVGIYNFGTPELLIRDPDLMKTVLQTNYNNFQRSGFGVDPEKDPLLSKNPFFSEGEAWKRQRSVLSNTMSTAKLKNMAIGLSEVCTKFEKYLEQQIKLSNGSYEVKAEDVFSRFTSEVVAKVAFGVDGNSFTDDPGNFLHVVKMIFEPSGFSAFKLILIQLCPILGTLFSSKFIPEKVDRYLRSIVREILEVRNQSGIRGNDFIQQINDSYKSESGDIDENFVVGHAVTFMIDGYLTTSYTLSSIAFELATHPQVQQKLREEIKQVLEKHENKITYEAIQDMKYMDLVIQESMRVFSVVSSITRTCTEEFNIIGSDGLKCIVRPGDKVVACPLGLQKDSKYWNNPDMFNPDRFKGEGHDLQKFINVTFGAGPRICPGMRLATLQMKGALTVLLGNSSIEISSKMKLPFTYDVTNIFNAVKGGIQIKIKPL